MYRVAIIGCGNIAGGYDEQSRDDVCQTHARACQTIDGISLSAVCDTNAERARRFAARWNASSFHIDASEMLQRVQPNIVCICSPTETHTEMIERCFKIPSIKAIICEKPMGYDSREIKWLLPKIETTGIVLAINYIRAYAPGIQFHKQRLTKMSGCVEAVVNYGKGVFNYGSHAIQWIADWLGEITNIEATDAIPGPCQNDPCVSASFLAGGVPVRLHGVSKDCFDIEFRCKDGALRFFDYSFHAISGMETFMTGIETVMRNVFLNVMGRLEGRPTRLVEGTEAAAILDICATLSAQSRRFL